MWSPLVPGGAKGALEIENSDYIQEQGSLEQ